METKTMQVRAGAKIKVNDELMLNEKGEMIPYWVALESDDVVVGTSIQDAEKDEVFEAAVYPVYFKEMQKRIDDAASTPSETIDRDFLKYWERPEIVNIYKGIKMTDLNHSDSAKERHKLLRYVFDRIGSEPKVIDVGSATGYHTEWMEEHCKLKANCKPKFTCVDTSRPMIELIQKNHPEWVTMRALGEDLSLFDKSSFDFVFCNDCTVSSAEPFRMFKELLRIGKGLFMINFFLKEGKTEIYKDGAYQEIQGIRVPYGALGMDDFVETLQPILDKYGVVIRRFTPTFKQVNHANTNIHCDIVSDCIFLFQKVVRYDINDTVEKINKDFEYVKGLMETAEGKEDAAEHRESDKKHWPDDAPQTKCIHCGHINRIGDHCANCSGEGEVTSG